MATRDVTPATLALADIFTRWRETGLDGMTKNDAGQLAGFKGDSTYRNIEAGREVSLGSYRQAARKLGLPGGEQRVEAILRDEPDPGPGPGQSVSAALAFHPAAPEGLATVGRLAELVGRLESLLRSSVERTALVESQLTSQRRELDTLVDRIEKLERAAKRRQHPRSNSG